MEEPRIIFEADAFRMYHEEALSKIMSFDTFCMLKEREGWLIIYVEGNCD